MNVDFSTRMEIIREHMGLTAKEFASRLGINQNTYHNYKTGRTPPADLLPRLLTESGVSPGWLLTGEGSMFGGEESLAPLPQATERCWVPILGRIQAGRDGRLLEDHAEAFVPLPSGYEDERNGNDVARHVLGFEISGHSMLPQYRPGEIVLCDRRAPVKSDDDVVLQLADGSTHCKLWQPIGSGRVCLRSYNQAPEYEPFEVDRDQVVDVVKITDTIWAWRAAKIKVDPAEILGSKKNYAIPNEDLAIAAEGPAPYGKK